MQAAAEDLLGLAPEGLQLTPGNAPTPGFEDWLATRRVTTRTHHGFHWRALRQPVWSPEAECLVASDSVHPPRARQGEPVARWREKAEAGAFQGRTLETMYPGYVLGTGEELEWAMDLGLRLAVDVSHLHIQQTAGVLAERTWRRLREYAHIDELHVSVSDGQRDVHRPLDADTFGLGWVRERLAAGSPVILECYMHRLSERERHQQMAVLRGSA
jgi:sugar phosphate isomerase/epimerase